MEQHSETSFSFLCSWILNYNVFYIIFKEYVALNFYEWELFNRKMTEELHLILQVLPHPGTQRKVKLSEIKAAQVTKPPMKVFAVWGWRCLETWSPARSSSTTPWWRTPAPIPAHCRSLITSVFLEARQTFIWSMVGRHYTTGEQKNSV